MNQPEKSTKRIVSKAEYVALMSKKAAMYLTGRLSIVAAWVGMIAAMVLIVGMIRAVSSGSFSPKPLPIILLVLFGYKSFDKTLNVLHQYGKCQIEEAKAMEDVITVTQANTTNLPASESLVRASSKPLQEQESVLLRASIHSQQTPAEQLLRSVKE